jgi:AMMECR1 domain-containing protein
VGVHGIIFESGKKRALFLPQVAPEWGWDPETTFRQLARKAGLPDTAWKDPDARFSLFRGQVFDESGALSS